MKTETTLERQQRMANSPWWVHAVGDRKQIFPNVYEARREILRLFRLHIQYNWGLV